MQCSSSKHNKQMTDILGKLLFLAADIIGIVFFSFYNIMIVRYFRHLKPQLLECCQHRISPSGHQHGHLGTSSLANNNGIEGNGGRPPVISKLKGLYCHKILPLERHYLLDKFYSPPLSEADFEANPMILMIGQYFTGKSSMIRYLDLEHNPHVCPNNLGTSLIRK